MIWSTRDERKQRAAFAWDLAGTCVLLLLLYSWLFETSGFGFYFPRETLYRINLYVQRVVYNMNFGKCFSIQNWLGVDLPTSYRVWIERRVFKEWMVYDLLRLRIRKRFMFVNILNRMKNILLSFYHIYEYNVIWTNIFLVRFIVCVSSVFKR